MIASLPDRHGASFPDPAAVGWKKFTTTNWIVEIIYKPVIEGGDDLQTEEGEVELYYELSDFLRGSRLVVRHYGKGVLRSNQAGNRMGM